MPFSYHVKFASLALLGCVASIPVAQANTVREHTPASGWQSSLYLYTDANQLMAEQCAENNYLPGVLDIENYADGSPRRFGFTCLVPGSGEEVTHPNLYNWGRQCQVGFTPISDTTLTPARIVRCELPIDAVVPGQREVSPECIGNPIIVNCRRKSQAEIDYRGTGDFPLVFARYYSSGTPGKVGLPFTDPSIKYWKHTYDRRLIGDLSPAQHVLPARWVILGNNGIHPQPLVYRRTPSGTAPERIINAERPDGSTVYFPLLEADANQKMALQETTLSNGDDGLVLTTASDEKEFYDLQGRLVALRSRAGETHTLTYNAAGLLHTVVNDYGHTLTLTYQNGRLSSLTDPNGKSIQYTYNTYGDFTTATYPNTGGGAKTRTYHYEAAPRQLTGITNERNKRYVSWSYDTDSQDLGLASESTGPNGIGRVQIDRDFFSSLSNIVTDTLGLETYYRYEVFDGSKLLMAKERQATDTTSAATETRTYDDNGFLASVTDWNGNTTTYERNARGLATSTTFAVGTPEERTLTRTWHSTYRLPLTEMHPDYSVNNTYDVKGNLKTRTVTDAVTAATRTWRYTYDAFGKLRTVDGPRTDVVDKTIYTYYNCITGARCGQLKTLKDPLGYITRFNSYNRHGQLTKMTDPNGVVYKFTYDARMRLKSQSVAGKVTRLAYDATGNLTRITLPDGTYTQYTWDNANRLTKIRDKANNQIIFTLDKAGNRTRTIMKEAGSGTLYQQRRTFDALSRMITRTYQHGGQVQMSYDANGNTVSVTDAANRTETHTYDALNRLVQMRDAILGETDTAYDEQDNMASVTDPEGYTTTYTTNGFGDRLSQVSPDTGTTTYTVDEAGNRLTQTDARGITENYTYDALNRLTHIDYPNGTESIIYTYDEGANGIGRLTTITDQTGSTRFTYDQRGNVIERTATIDTISYTKSFTYNNADRLTSITYPGGRTVTYTYDTSGRVQSVASTDSAGNVEDLATNIDRLPYGPVESMTLGNGMTRTRQYDKGYRIEHSDDGPVFSRHYAWNAVNNITAITDSINTANTQLFGYDDLDRLDFATGGYGERSYTYDGIGNRLTDERTAGTNNGTDAYTYFGANHRLRKVGSKRNYRYDAAGNPTRDCTRHYTYNQQGRLNSATKGGVKTDYLHNALGQRVVSSNPSKTRHFIYNLDGQVIAEGDGSGAIDVEYSYVDGEPLSLWRAPSTRPIRATAGTPVNSITDTNPAYAWDPVGTATNYQIRVYNDNTSQRIHISSGTASNLCTGTTCEKSVNLTLTANTNYYWQVRAKNVKGWGSWSAKRRFSVAGGQ